MVLDMRLRLRLLLLIQLLWQSIAIVIVLACLIQQDKTAGSKFACAKSWCLFEHVRRHEAGDAARKLKGKYRRFGTERLEFKGLLQNGQY